MKYFDLHCDTADELYTGKKELYSNNLAVSLEKAEAFEKYVQLYAIFTRTELDDEEGWTEFLRTRENFLAQCEKYGVRVINSGDELEEFDKGDGRFAAILTVEDARILGGKLGRVYEMKKLGVKVVTPLWGGLTCVGGSHNTDAGLTPFGRKAVYAMAECGIIPDISHSSFRSADEITEICDDCGVSPIATHMNSYSVCAHSRNLTDERFRRLCSLGGIAGVSLCPPHLVYGKGHVTASPDAVVPHFRKYDSLCAGHVSFGCDMDGTSLPEGIHGIEDIPALCEILAENGFTEEKLESITYGAAYNFMRRNMR